MASHSQGRSGRPSTQDAYSELLSQTRGLHREQQQAREVWYAGLLLDRKEDVLFELEILLKGIACFSNPRNHPGPPRRAPVVAVDFAGPLGRRRWGPSIARATSPTGVTASHGWSGSRAGSSVRATAPSCSSATWR